jgi:hypothetical protein
MKPWDNGKREPGILMENTTIVPVNNKMKNEDERPSTIAFSFRTSHPLGQSRTLQLISLFRQFAQLDWVLDRSGVIDLRDLLL